MTHRLFHGKFAFLPVRTVCFAAFLRGLTLCADPELLSQVEAEVKKEIEIIKELSAYASQYPYYK